MPFDKIRQVIKTLTGGTTAPTTPATPAASVTPTVSKPDTLSLALASMGGTAVAPAVDTSSFADPIEIRTFDHQGLSIITVDGLDAAKAQAQWLTKGKDRTQSATAVLLKDCTTDHLINIVANKPNLSADYHRIIESILEDRNESLPDDLGLN